MTTLGCLLHDVIPDAAHALLQSNHIILRPSLGRAPHYDVVAVIGFSGSGFGGALGVAAERSLIAGSVGESDSVLSDSWLGEIANQLLGRLKNVLLRYDVEIRLAIPMVLHGLDLKLRGGEDHIKQFQYDSQFGSISVWVDANWNVHQPMTLVDNDQLPQAEGELMLF